MRGALAGLAGAGQNAAMSDAPFVPVAAAEALPDGGTLAVSVGARQILLCHDEGRIFAIENLCSHAESPLECGRVRWGVIVCPAHGARFDLATGEPVGPPATMPIRTFALRVIDGTIEVAA